MAVARKTRKAPVIGKRVSAHELIHNLPGSKLMDFPSGDTLFREGSGADSCFFLLQGRVQILKKTQQGGKVLLATVKPGEFVGEMAMLSGERRSASAVAVTKVKSVIIQHAEFEKLLEAQHSFAGRLSLQLSGLLAARCHRLLRLLARQPSLHPLPGKKPADVRAVLNRVYTLWAV